MGFDTTWLTKTEQLEQEMHAIAEQQEAHLPILSLGCFAGDISWEFVGYTRIDPPGITCGRMLSGKSLIKGGLKRREIIELSGGFSSKPRLMIGG